MRHIDTANETNSNHTIRLVDDATGEEQEITIATPSAGKIVLCDADVNLMPIPQEDPETTLQNAIAALEEVTNTSNHIRVNLDEIHVVFKNSLMTTVCLEEDSPIAIGNRLSDSLSKLGVPANAITGMVFSIACSSDLNARVFYSVIANLRQSISNESAVIFGVKFADISTLRVTALLAISTK